MGRASGGPVASQKLKGTKGEELALRITFFVGSNFKSEAASVRAYKFRPLFDIAFLFVWTSSTWIVVDGLSIKSQMQPAIADLAARSSYQHKKKKKNSPFASCIWTSDMAY